MSCPLAIITPLYATEQNDRLKYFEHTAKSILQSSTPFLWIIVNDDSPDPKTSPFLNDLNDKRIVVFNRKKEAGDIATASNALNLGISAAIEQDARAITYVHSDDILFPHSLERRLELIHEGNDMACGRIAYIHGDEAHIPLQNSSGVLEAFESHCYKFPHHTSMWSQAMVRAMINERGYIFDGSISYGEDLDVSLLARATLRENSFSIGISDAVVYGWVGNPQNITGQTERKSVIGILQNHRAYRDIAHLLFDNTIDIARKNLKQPLFWLPESIKAPLRPVKATIRKVSGGRLYRPYCDTHAGDIPNLPK